MELGALGAVVEVDSDADIDVDMEVADIVLVEPLIPVNTFEPVMLKFKAGSVVLFEISALPPVELGVEVVLVTKSTAVVLISLELPEL